MSVRRRPLAIFSLGFRPFFLSGAAWAAFALPIWVAAYLGLVPGVDRDWHVHEMVFGFLPAIIAGFLLTAVPNWTGRPALTGAPLGAIWLLWLTGRVTQLVMPGELTAAMLDSAFLFCLLGVVAREIAAARNLRNAPVAGMVLILASANAATHFGSPDWAPIGARIGIAAVTMMIALIGGRITPNFTRNWMMKAGAGPLPASEALFDRMVLALTAVCLTAWCAIPSSVLTGSGLVLSGLATLWRLSRWRGWKTTQEPLVFILHVGYLWLGCGISLLGLSCIVPDGIPYSAGLHAVTSGAFGVMTLAVMTRASLGHTGRALSAGGLTQAIYVLANLGAAGRVAAAFVPAQVELLALSAAAWCGAFALFCAVYGPLLLKPRSAP